MPLERIWNDPQNQQLRELRKHSDVLYPGDKVFIPPRKIKTFSRFTGQSHVFLKRTPKAELKLRIFLNGQPCGNIPCTLDAALQQPEQTTDDKGQVIFAIKAELDQAELIVRVLPVSLREKI